TGRRPPAPAVTHPGRHDPGQLRLLACHVADRAVDIAEAPAGQPPYTDGRIVYVSRGAPLEQQRREALLQAGLLGAGSLDPALVRPLRARTGLARRYLAVEGRRVLAALADRLPLAAELHTGGTEKTCSAAESLEVAGSRD